MINVGFALTYYHCRNFLVNSFIELSLVSSVLNTVGYHLKEIGLIVSVDRLPQKKYVSVRRYALHYPQ